VVPSLAVCTTNFSAVAIYSYNYSNCLNFVIPDTLRPFRHAHLPAHYNQTLYRCLNRTVQNHVGLGVAHLGTDQTVSDSALDPPLEIVPYLQNIEWHASGDCKTGEVWFSLDLRPLPRGRYLVFYSELIGVTYVVTTGLCTRRYFQLEDGQFIGFVDMVEFQYELGIMNDGFETLSAPIHLTVMKHMVLPYTYTLCIGWFANATSGEPGHLPICIAAKNTLGGIETTDFITTPLPNNQPVASIYYAAAYDNCLSEQDVLYLYEQTPFASKWGLKDYRGQNYSKLTYEFPNPNPPTPAPTTPFDEFIFIGDLDGFTGDSPIDLGTMCIHLNSDGTTGRGVVSTMKDETLANIWIVELVAGEWTVVHKFEDAEYLITGSCSMGGGATSNLAVVARPTGVLIIIEMESVWYMFPLDGGDGSAVTTTRDLFFIADEPNSQIIYMSGLFTEYETGVLTIPGLSGYGTSIYAADKFLAYGGNSKVAIIHETSPTVWEFLYDLTLTRIGVPAMALAMSSDAMILAVGMPQEDNNKGYVEIYIRLNTLTTAFTYVTDIESPIDTPGVDSFFGVTLTIQEDILMIGCPTSLDEHFIYVYRITNLGEIDQVDVISSTTESIGWKISSYGDYLLALGMHIPNVDGTGSISVYSKAI